MNRPRNRQYRPPRNDNTNSGNFSNRSQAQIGHSNVPTTQQVKPGASVSIVLKADQRTGREVQGVVKDVLTRGNHPHGIKVRLQDERIGRVQRMMGNVSATFNQLTTVSQVPLEVKQQVVPNITDDGNSEPQTEIKAETGSEIKSPADQITNRTEYSLKQGKKSKRQVFKTESEDQLSPSTVLQCPICGDFEGDEIAVSYHVEQHLDTKVESPE